MANHPRFSSVQVLDFTLAKKVTAGTGSGSTQIPLPTNEDGNVSRCLTLDNLGTNVVYVNWGDDTVTVAATDGNFRTVIHGGGTVDIYVPPATTHIVVITESGSSDVTISGRH